MHRHCNSLRNLVILITSAAWINGETRVSLLRHLGVCNLAWWGKAKRASLDDIETRMPETQNGCFTIFVYHRVWILPVMQIWMVLRWLSYGYVYDERVKLSVSTRLWVASYKLVPYTYKILKSIGIEIISRS